MIRFIFIIGLAFAAPFVVYALYRLIKGGPAPDSHAGALARSTALGIVCAMIALALLTMNQGSRDGVYVPPSLQDGEVRPGRFEPADERRRDPAEPSQRSLG